MKRTTSLLSFLSFLLACASVSSAQPRRPHFDATNPDVHDPVMALCEGRYYLFATGFGISCMSSADLLTWQQERPVLMATPQWAMDSIQGYRGHTWAPDIQYYKGWWYLFYSCSSFGKNTSAIGVAVSKTLNPQSPDFAWHDQGMVVRSHRESPYNCIDPNMMMDHDGRLWLTWGSFWDGIQQAQLQEQGLDSLGAPRLVLASQPHTVARRRAPRSAVPEADMALANEAPDAGPNAIEAPFMIHHDGWYYLLASWDYCCKGARSNYKTVVGRSRDPQGPFLDRDDRDMVLGGGTLLAGPDDAYYGIGHCGIVVYPYAPDGVTQDTYFVAHGYATVHGGASKLFLRRLTYDAQSWPVITP